MEEYYPEEVKAHPKWRNWKSHEIDENVCYACMTGDDKLTQIGHESYLK